MKNVDVWLGAWPAVEKNTIEVDTDTVSDQAVTLGVVMPAHQSESTLRESVNSVLASLGANDVLVIIENASKDNTYEIARELAKGDARIVVLQSDIPDAANARNMGVDYLKTDLVSFCDSDDTWDAEKVSIVKRISARYDSDIIIHPLRTSPSCGGVEGHAFLQKQLPNSNSLLQDLVVYGSFFATSSVTIKRKVMAASFFQNGLTHCQDYEAWCCLARRHPNAKFAYIDRALGYYLKHNGLSKNFGKRHFNHLSIVMKYSESLPAFVRYKAFMRNITRFFFYAFKEGKLFWGLSAILNKKNYTKIRP